PTKYNLAFPSQLVVSVTDPVRQTHLGIAVVGETDGVELRIESGIVFAQLPRSRSPRRLGVVYRRTPDPTAITSLVTNQQKHSEWVKGAEVRLMADRVERRGAKQRSEPIITKIER